MNTSKSAMIAVIVSVLMSLPFFGYMWNLLMHIVGAVLFMGNIIVTAAWASSAKRSGSPEAIRFAAKGIAKTDVMFTTPGAILLLLNGGIIGTEWFKSGDLWLMISVGLFLLTVIIWLALLVPTQRKLAVAVDQTTGVDPVSDDAMALLGKWFKVGGIATLLPFIILVLMVLKPNF